MTKKTKTGMTPAVVDTANRQKSILSKATKTRSHSNLNSWDTIRLWVAAGGRCQICNKLLTESENTFNSLNLGERAHMVAQASGGPRGQDDLSDVLAKSIENVMLLCLACHKEIDDDKQQAKFPVVTLKGLKIQHEERIRYLTKLKSKRTSVLLFTTPIRQAAGGGQPEHDREVVLHRDEAFEALLPDSFPDSSEPMRVRVEVTEEETPEYWLAAFRQIKSRYDAKVQWEGVQQLSIFALGKIPAMAYLGQLIGDARPVKVFNVSNGSPQKWQEAAPVNFSYVIHHPEDVDNKAKQIILHLSLSGQVEPLQYEDCIPEVWPTYEIANEPRHQQLNWLVEESQLKLFGKAYQDMLGHIQRTHGQDAVIHIFTAVPSAVAIELGRLYRANSHPQIEIYNCVAKRFSPALTLGRKI